MTVYQSKKHQKPSIKSLAKLAVLEQDAALGDQYDASVLYILHKRFGFGKERLARFYAEFLTERDRLKEKFLLEADEVSWSCKYFLERDGLPISDIRERAEQIKKGEKK